MEKIVTGRPTRQLLQEDRDMTARTKPLPFEPTPDPNKFKCEDCDYIGGSKSVVTRHWNETHRKRHAQKRGTKKRNQKMGAPTVLTPMVVGKLVAAFQNGLTKTQAFRYAGIGKDAYYDGMKRDKDFAEKMIAAQEHLNYKAREVIAKAISDGSDLNSRWWLERKNKEEFSPRREVTGNKGGPVRTVTTELTIEVNDDELNEAIFG